jgi:hypothetical protein
MSSVQRQPPGPENQGQYVDPRSRTSEEKPLFSVLNFFPQFDRQHFFEIDTLGAARILKQLPDLLMVVRESVRFQIRYVVLLQHPVYLY